MELTIKYLIYYYIKSIIDSFISESIMKIDSICTQCGISFERERKYVNASLRTRLFLYCSRKCFRAAKANSIKSTCFTCGIELSKTVSQSKRTKSGRLYCSRSCAITQNNRNTNRNYKNGLSVYRKQALIHLGSSCRICGYNNQSVLEVHHIDCNRNNNNLNNLDVLCPTHHKEVQLGIRSNRVVA